MISIISLLFSSLVYASNPNPSPFPIFLKMGFSSILDFEEAPTKVVLGDSQFFQIEKLNNSIAIKALTPFATTNMFVYFKTTTPKLFVLTASDDVDPTYYKKFESLNLSAPSLAPKAPIKYRRELNIVSARFDQKKDYLTVEVNISADSAQILKPEWSSVRLLSKNKTIEPQKLWSERKDIQKDSKIRARFIFYKPNLPRDLKDTSLVVPILGSTKSLSALFHGVSI